jgi:clan AA aspartic protease
MITGRIGPDRKAVILLQLHGPGAGSREVSAVIDTGFTGALALPSAVIRALGLPHRGGRRANLADGSRTQLDAYEVTVIWDGAPTDVIALAAERPPLVGMALLFGSLMTMHLQDGGRVTIEPLP